MQSFEQFLKENYDISPQSPDPLGSLVDAFTRYVDEVVVLKIAEHKTPKVDI